MATRTPFQYFIGSKRQVANQGIQWIILCVAFGVAIRMIYSALGIPNEGWWMIAYIIKTGLSWGLSYFLIRGKLGELLNGERLPEQVPAPALADTQSLVYYPLGGSLPMDQAPKREPIRQKEGQ